MPTTMKSPTVGDFRRGAPVAKSKHSFVKLIAHRYTFVHLYFNDTWTVLSYSPVPSPALSYSILLSLTRSYSLLLSLTLSYSPLLPLTLSYSLLLSLTLHYSPLLSRTPSYSLLLSLTIPYLPPPTLSDAPLLNCDMGHYFECTMGGPTSNGTWGHLL